MDALEEHPWLASSRASALAPLLVSAHSCAGTPARAVCRARFVRIPRLRQFGEHGTLRQRPGQMKSPIPAARAGETIRDRSAVSQADSYTADVQDRRPSPTKREDLATRRRSLRPAGGSGSADHGVPCKQVAQPLRGLDGARAAPAGEFGDIHSAVGGLAVVDPRLRRRSRWPSARWVSPAPSRSSRRKGGTGRYAGSC